MSVKQIDVIQEQVTAANVSLYTAPTSASFESAAITYANCVNVGTVDTDLTINIVQVSGSVAVTNQYLPPTTIYAGSAHPLTPIVGATLKAGDFISSIGSLASNLNLKITVREIYTDA
jgi:hypothetical protein